MNEKYQIIKNDDAENEEIVPELDETIDKVFSSLIQLNEKDIVNVKSCRLCNHRYRFEVEDFWEKNDFNSSKAVEFLNNKIEEDNESKSEEEEEENLFQGSSVRNHLKKHFREQEKQLRLKDYSEKIKNVMALKQKKSQLLEMSLAVCQENLSSIASAETNGDIKLEKIRSENINKTVSTMLSIIETQNKIEGEISSSKAIQEKLINIWVDAIQKEKSDAKKQVLYKMLEEFVNQIQGDDDNVV